MTKTDHLARAKEYIAVAESGDAKLAAYMSAAIEIRDSGVSQHEAARYLERSRTGWLKPLLDWGRKFEWGGLDPDHPPFGGEDQNKGRYAREQSRQAKQTLIDPERRKTALSSLTAGELDEVQREATEALVSRSRAERAEHQTKPTVRELTGGEKFDPAETWADAHITRVWTAASTLRHHNRLFEDCTADEFEQRVQVKQENAEHVNRRLAVDKVVSLTDSEFLDWDADCGWIA